jgi:hypothetical protein
MDAMRADGARAETGTEALACACARACVANDIEVEHAEVWSLCRHFVPLGELWEIIFNVCARFDADVVDGDG